MAEYPKNFEKDGRVKVAPTRKREVELKFAGYREVPAEEPVKEAPELTEAEMAKLPEAKDADVVDTTEVDWEANGGAVKPSEDELAENEADKSADPKAYLANQSNTGGGAKSADARNARKR